MELKLKQRPKVLNGSAQGFTLIELMVAMTIALVVLGGMYVSYRSQQKSYMEQEEVAVMQQNLRAAMFYMQREIRLAGYDPSRTAACAGIATASAGTINVREDIDANGSCSGGLEDITYTLSPSGTTNTLVRNAGAGNQAVAENIDALDFVFLSGGSPPTVLNPSFGSVSAANLSQIRAVEITIVARASKPLRAVPNNHAFYNQRDSVNPIFVAPNDRFSRKQLTAVVKCRNLGF